MLVAAYASAVLLPFLGSARTLTPHEVMVTHPAQRLLEDGQWIVPHFAGGWWLDKPPLVNWVTAASFAALGGFSEFAARLPAALSGIAVCVLMAAVAAHLLSPRVGLLSGLAQATTVYVYMQARLGEIDMPFTFLVAAAHAVLLWLWGRGEIRLPVAAGLLFHLLAALAVLTKGLLAVVFLGATVLMFCVFRRSWRPLRCALVTPGIAIFVLITGWWHWAAWQVAGAEALEQWGYNGLMRFFGLHHLGVGMFFLYFWAVPWLMLPWTIALVLGAGHLRRALREPGAGVHQFLWAWFLGGLIFLTVCLFKHTHYVMPLLPPLSVLTGTVLDAHIARAGVRARRFYAAVFAAALLIFGLVGGYILPRQDHRRATAEFVRRATAQVPPDETLYVIGLAQSSAYPYIAHRPCAYLDTLAGVEEALQQQDGRPLWALSLCAYLEEGTAHGLAFDAVACEPVRKKHPFPETAILGRLSRGAPATSSRAAP